MGKGISYIFKSLESMKVTFIATVFNEEENILKLLNSLFRQKRLADEIVFVDGGSSDKTVDILKAQLFRNKRFTGKYKVLEKRGNRSVGRNVAVRNATGEIIVCSDAGCVLDELWIQEIIKPFKHRKTEVVAGYYQGYPKGIFQKCLVPYVLVMPDRVDPDNFLPASRSLAFKKDIWKKAGGFAERFSHNEDYVFAKKLKEMNYNIVFRKQAVTYWLPRKNLFDAFIMFFRFALGDAEAKVFRPKVGVIFLRYVVGILLLLLAIISRDVTLFIIFSVLAFAYLTWAVWKNYKYINDYRAILILPILQIVSDIAVITGTVIGFFKIWDIQKKR